MKKDLPISIIVPVLNEEENIEELLLYLDQFHHDFEIIIVDGGSVDNTVKKISGTPTVLHSVRGRAIQMNVGAEKAVGDVLWFIHADCRPGLNSAKLITKTLLDNKIVGGAFEYTLDKQGAIYRLTEFLSNLKNHFFGLFYGDMGIFVKKQVFDRMNGFREIPLMEDMDFCRRLKQEGKIVILPEKMTTSARRWEKEGALKNIVRNWFLQIAWVSGIDPEILAKWYKFKSR